MKPHVAVLIVVLGSAWVLGGCITHQETVYREPPRVAVAFENDTAARIFYETLSRCHYTNGRTESKTEVSLPLVFKDERRVVTGENAAFNRAVAECDTDKDGRITVKEARIFAERHKAR